MFGFIRERTRPEAVLYGLYLYWMGLSLRHVADALDPFVKRGHVSIWKWIQLFGKNTLFHRRRVTAFLVDETYIRIGRYEAWVWIAIEPVHRYILGVYLSYQRNIMVAEFFLRTLVKMYGKHVVYTDEGVWYPDACNSLGLEHRIHTTYEKSLIERVNQYLKDRTEGFDDHYPCRKKGCGLSHVRRWLNLFCFMYNQMRDRVKFDGLLNLMEVSP
jgi:putative transposase